MKKGDYRWYGHSGPKENAEKWCAQKSGKSIKETEVILLVRN